jgi:hypothetical protein
LRFATSASPAKGEQSRNKPAQTRGVLSALIVFSFCVPAVAFAAHPLISEDTATQGQGAFELELGNMWSTDDRTRSYEFGPQLSYGVSKELDAIISV